MSENFKSCRWIDPLQQHAYEKRLVQVNAGKQKMQDYQKKLTATRSRVLLAEEFPRSWNKADCTQISADTRDWTNGALSDNRFDKSNCYVKSWPQENDNACCDPTPGALDQFRKQKDTVFRDYCFKKCPMKKGKMGINRLDTECFKRLRDGKYKVDCFKGWAADWSTPLGLFCNPDWCPKANKDGEFKKRCRDQKSVEAYCKSGNNLFSDARCRKTCRLPRQPGELPRPAWCEHAVKVYCKKFPNNDECACAVPDKELKKFLKPGVPIPRPDCLSAKCQEMRALKDSDQVLQRDFSLNPCQPICANYLDVSSVRGNVDVGKIVLSNECKTQLNIDGSKEDDPQPDIDPDEKSDEDEEEVESDDKNKFDVQEFIYDLMQHPQDHMVEIGLGVVILILLFK